MRSHQTHLRVRYAETDQMGVVYYANYLVWMEVARVDYCKSVGFSYEEMEREDGIFLAVSEAHCRYHHPARYDELLIVRTSILEAKNRTLKFGYELFRQSDKKLLATGHTIHVACNRAGQVKHFPDKYKQAFLSLAKHTN